MIDENEFYKNHPDVGKLKVDQLITALTEQRNSAFNLLANATSTAETLKVICSRNVALLQAQAEKISSLEIQLENEVVYSSEKDTRIKQLEEELAKLTAKLSQSTSTEE